MLLKDKLKLIMDERGIKVAHLVKKTKKATQNTIYRTLSGDDPRMSTVYDLAQALDMSIEEFVRGTEWESKILDALRMTMYNQTHP